MSLIHFQLLSAALFSIGVYGVLANLIAFGAYGDKAQDLGQIIAIFVITVAAAEVGLAMAIILRMFRDRSSVDLDEVDLMKW